MDMGRQLRDISRGFEIVAASESFKHLPVIIGESDPEGCAACSMQDYPENAYRNGMMYSSYTAASFARKYALADRFGVNFLGAVSWSFEFENQPWFNGYRDLATNGVDKPVLNVFRMFGMMSGSRVEVSGDLAYDALKIRDKSVRAEADINALASKSAKSVCVMLWNYHDDDFMDVPLSPVEVTLTGLPNGRVLMHHYRIDRDHSNSYEVWKQMGSPQNPTAGQIEKLEAAGQLQLLNSPEYITVKDGRAVVTMFLPRQAVSLIKLDW
jgi:xylan 1,4-beta-xylosidase